MKTVILKSLTFTFLSVIASLVISSIVHTNLYLSDVGGLGAFVTVFGTLYGIMAAFVVFEVWNQYNTTTNLIEKEAQGLERLYRLTIYFRDKALSKKMHETIKEYADLVIKGNFQKLGAGGRNKESGKKFRKLTEVINTIKFDDDHDSIVFDHIVSHYGHLSEVRTDRINQSLARLPILLKIFLYSNSLLALATFLIMPFANIYYSLIAISFLSFIISMVYQLVEDLDDPFVGHWNITPEPFERALKHIEEDY